MKAAVDVNIEIMLKDHHHILAGDKPQRPPHLYMMHDDAQPRFSFRRKPSMSRCDRQPSLVLPLVSAIHRLALLCQPCRASIPPALTPVQHPPSPLLTSRLPKLNSSTNASSTSPPTLALPHRPHPTRTLRLPLTFPTSLPLLALLMIRSKEGTVLTTIAMLRRHHPLPCRLLSHSDLCRPCPSDRNRQGQGSNLNRRLISPPVLYPSIDLMSMDINLSQTRNGDLLYRHRNHHRHRLMFLP